MKKRRIILSILVASLVVSLLICGTVLAYMFRQTEYKDNEFVPANVSCEVVEAFDGVQKTSVQVQNTGNIDAFLRVRFVSYWVDADGNIVAKPSSMPEREKTTPIITQSLLNLRHTLAHYYHRPSPWKLMRMDICKC